MQNEVVDILIIGAGASSAAAVYSLSSLNVKILCLEQGDWMNSSHYPSNYKDWQILRNYKYNQSPNIRKMETDYPINEEDSDVQVANFNGVGGGTILYSGHFPRMKPSDFRVNTLDGVADDWPINYQTLNQYFSQNDINMGVSGLRGDPAIPLHELPLPPIAMGRMGEIIGHGFNKLGWHWWPSDTAIISEDYDGRGKCINLSPCNSGCSQGAKSSVDISYWPKNLRKRGVELRTRCRVREIIVDSNDMAKGVIYFDENGVEQKQYSEMVILACNGIGTPRILLNSTSKYFPDGLANRSGLVGKNLMFHPWGRVEGTFQEMLHSHLGAQGSCLLSHEFYETDKKRDFVRGYTLQVVRGQPPVNTAIHGYLKGTIPLGYKHHEAFLKYYGKQISIEIMCEDLPEESNCVTIDPELTDSHGIPAPKISYRLGENSKKMLKHASQKATIALEESGAIETYSHGQVRETGWHNMGTARMGNDSKKSVVNEWGRSHDVKNLFIIDGSIFVTSGAVNPTTTIQALSLYISDQIKNNISNLFD